MKEIKSLSELRSSINDIDKKIKELICERLTIVKEIGIVKQSENIQITDSTRENQIFLDNLNYEYPEALNSIYQVLMSEAKLLQKPLTGLVGKKLPYTYSKEFHEYYNNMDYHIFETDNFEKFLTNYNIKKANITMPYKSALTGDIISVITKSASGYDSVNQDGQAFLNCLSKNGIPIRGRHVLILGNGATAKTVIETLKARVETITVVGRQKKFQGIDGITEITFSDTFSKKHINLIINTTPYGSYPNLEVKPIIDLNGFTSLESVCDLVYNPFRSSLLLTTQNLYPRIKTCNGLFMLAECARLSESLWQNKEYPQSMSFRLEKATNYQKTNLVLIGMPLSGKSTVGRFLATLTHRKFIDSDEVIKPVLPFDIQEISDQEKLQQFREAEKKVIYELAKSSGQVIATGGGVILDPDNLNILKQTGLIIYLDTDIKTLQTRYNFRTATTPGLRPLLVSPEVLLRTYMERQNLYNSSADINIKVNIGAPSEIAKRVYRSVINYFYPHKE